MADTSLGDGNRANTGPVRCQSPVFYRRVHLTASRLENRESRIGFAGSESWGRVMGPSHGAESWGRYGGCEKRPYLSNESAEFGWYLQIRGGQARRP